ncbi:MAG: carbohydrate-binding protein, partial [Deltaproteobacteria bacterium]|nr:carbohydrate-binding protein [Deltaproteobacteria bacterium]
EHLGAAGLVMDSGCKRNRVEGCVFRDISASAITLGDIDQPNPDTRLLTSGIEVLNNHISGIGREYLDSPGILMGYTEGNRIEHNEIFDLPYTGISLGWGWSLSPSAAQQNLIAHNRVGYAMQRLVDGGLIYTLSTQPDSSISGNFLHNQVHDYGAIYLDQGSQHFSVTDNVIASAPNWIIMQPTVQPVAQGNVVRDNYTDTEDEMCCGSQGCCTDWNTFENNPLFSPGGYPAEALSIIDATGLETAWNHIRPASQTVEAEAYNHGGFGVGFVDYTPWDSGDDYRDDYVDVYRCTACSNDHAVGATLNNEWLAYNLDVFEAGTHDFAFRVATQGGTSAIELQVDGQSSGSLALPNTGGLDTFARVELNGVSLDAGVHVIRLVFTGNCMLDFFTVSRP